MQAEQTPPPAKTQEVILPPPVVPILDGSQFLQENLLFVPTDAAPAVPLSPADQAKQTAAEAESAIQTQLWTNIDTMLDQVPPGTAVDRTQFEARFGIQSAQQLEKAGLVSVTNTAKPPHVSHFVLVFNGKGTVDTKNGELDHGITVDFDYSKSPNGQVDLEKVQGLTCKGKSGIKSWGTATVDDVTIVHEKNGNVQLTGKAHWEFFHGQATYEFGPDGKQIVQPAPQTAPAVPGVPIA